MLFFLNKHTLESRDVRMLFYHKVLFTDFGKVSGYVRPGVTAGKAAGMEVVAVPSIPKSHLYTEADEVINSLLDLQPELWGLPPFEDWMEGALPIEPWHIGGPVVKGFGRGSKVLGIPTANLSTKGYSALLSEHPSGVYFGWAGLSSQGLYKMVMSIGWNPYFNNTEKTIEPWLLHEFDGDFYGEELRLVIVGYIRPEANFSSLESLIAKIHEDRRIAERALDIPMYSQYRDDPYLKVPPIIDTDNLSTNLQSIMHLNYSWEAAMQTHVSVSVDVERQDFCSPGMASNDI
ncbi:RIBOFLAVIN KINASE/FMN ADENYLYLTRANSFERASE [Salix koriyanagi]|uniref:riboflavin kinase n=1 Tax=Salix koriyanagi TaxID=2511006 RepID=A0A9Q0YRM0_9ROSI|nr:RIBOFLAVIN KINASE/FMN ADENYLYLTRANSFERASE [Salix koriyanagi]